MADRYRYFRIEARELLEELGKGTLELERGPPPVELVPRLLRLAHTLKGAARVMKQPEIADAAHAIEDALAPLRERPAPLQREEAGAILAHLDGIERRVRALGPGEPPEPAEGATSSPAPVPAPSAEDAFRGLRADVEQLDGLLDGLAEATVQLGAVRGSLHELTRCRHAAELVAGQLAATRDREPPAGGGVRLASKASALTEELRGRLERLERGLTSGLEQLGRELRVAREGAEQLRLFPASGVFPALQRVARDGADAAGKAVELVPLGGEIRLDARVLSAIQPALVQLVRNAVAHGIERSAERLAAGKPARGRITVEVVHRGRRVSFACADDGRGLDLQALRGAAAAKGLGGERELPVEELLRLLLQGGLTTSGVVTQHAGRGVGLDVVRNAAAALGGEVTVHSEPGAGTRLELTVPMSLLSLEALLVEAGGVAAAIPLRAVRRTVRLDPRRLARSPAGDCLEDGGTAIPFLALAPALLGAAGRGPGSAAVILEGGGALLALGVDRLLGSESVVLRALPALALAGPLVAGASLDAGGDPRLVLDPEALAVAARNAPASAPTPLPRRAPLLVVDDSLTTRMLEQSILESAGYEVELAVSGEEALQKARQGAYSLFLVDVEMPGMDGFALLEQLRAEPALASIPAILVTSRNAPEDRRRGVEVGARAYVVKSEFDQGELLSLIRGLVG